MKRLKKSLSLLAVVAFLITALVPMSALAAPSGSGQIVDPPRPGGIIPNPPAGSSSVYGQFINPADGRDYPNTSPAFRNTTVYAGIGKTDDWTVPGDAVNAIQPVYAWKGRQFSIGVPSGYELTAGGWQYVAAASAGALQNNLPTINDAKGWGAATDTPGITLAGDSSLTIDDEANDFGSGANRWSNDGANTNEAYVFGIVKPIGDTSGTLYMTPIYQLIPVQACVSVTPTSSSQYAWGSTGPALNASWENVTYPPSNSVSLGALAAPPASTLYWYAYQDSSAGATTMSGTGAVPATVGGPQGSVDASSLPWQIQTNNNTYPIVPGATYQYVCYGASNYQQAQGDAALPVGILTGGTGTAATLTQRNVVAPASNTTAVNDVNQKYSRGVGAVATIEQVRVDDRTEGAAVAGTNFYTLPAVQGAVTVLEATLPPFSYGVWTIAYHDTYSPNGIAYTVSVTQTSTAANVNLTNNQPGYTSAEYWNGATKVTDVTDSPDGKNFSRLQFVMPKDTLQDNDVTIWYRAVTQLPLYNTPAITQSWPTTQITSYPSTLLYTSDNAQVSSNAIQYGLLPAVEAPAVGSVNVSPTTKYVAKDQDAQFDIALSPPGKLEIYSVTATLKTEDAFLGGASIQPLTVALKPDNTTDPTNTTWTLDTKDVPVGIWEAVFNVTIFNNDVAPGTPNYTYTLTTDKIVFHVLQFQGRITNSDKPHTWSVKTGPVNASANQVLDLEAEWLSAVNQPNAVQFSEQGNPTATSPYSWHAYVLDTSTGYYDTNHPVDQWLTKVDDFHANFRVPTKTESPDPANSWIIVGAPVTNQDQVFSNSAVTYEVNRVVSNPIPKITGYSYSVTPASEVWPAATKNSGAMPCNTILSSQLSQHIPSAWTSKPGQWSDQGGFAVAGSTVRMTANLAFVNDPTAMNYQWMVHYNGGWTPLVEGEGVSGVTAQTLTIAASAHTKDWQFYCVVTNKSNSAYTANNPLQFLALNVRTPGEVNPEAAPMPLIVSNPQTGSNPVQNPSNVTTVTVSTGMTVTLGCYDMNTTDGAPAALPNEWLSFQWMSASSATGTFTNIEGATGPTYSIVATPENSGTVYQCHVVNTVSQGLKSANSNKIVVRTKSPDGSVWFTEPASTPNPYNVRPGAEITMTAKARTDNDDAVKYQWQVARVEKNTSIDAVLPGAWVDVTGATDDTLTVTAAKGYYFYRCVATNVKNAGKNATSLPFRVNVATISNVPVVTPAHKTALGAVNNIYIGAEPGNDVTFQVNASVPTNDNLAYVWKVVQPHASGNSLTFDDPVQAANATVLEGGSDGSLTITASPEYNGSSFVCQVINAANEEVYTYSAVWNLTVWPTNTIPQIMEEPRDITATYPTAYAEGNPEDRQTAVKVAVPMPNDTTNPGPGFGTNAVLEMFQGGQWVAVPNSIVQFVPSTASRWNPELNNDKNAATWTAEVLLSDQAYTANGQYRFAITGYEPAKSLNWTAPTATPGGTGLMPTAYTDPFTVTVTVIGQPVIAEQPKSQTVKLGETATFSVTAQVEPSTAQLTYRWQISTDDGATWANCLDADGTGAGSATFTTVPTTVGMQNQAPIQYRCVVQNLNTKQSVTSAAAGLWIEDAAAPAAVSIAVADGTDLTITEKDGVKYLCGNALEVTKDGTTVAQLKAMIAAPAEGYTLQVTAADGAEKEDDAIVGTSDLLKLVSAAGEAADQVTIVVRGDVLGTGTMSLTQMVRMAEAYRPSDPNPLEGAFLMAGDLTGTGTIDLTDLVQEAGIYKTEIMAAE